MIAVERQEIYLRRLPASLNGFRIVHLSDLHYGPMVEPRHLERAIAIANDLNPDLIALTGDYISQERAYAAPCAEIVGRLRARYGVYAILGNHDHWTDAKLITDLFRAEGVSMLINEGTRIDARGARVFGLLEGLGAVVCSAAAGGGKGHRREQAFLSPHEHSD